MRCGHILAALALAALSCASQAEVANAPYWRAKAACWSALAAAERAQGDEHGTPAIAQGNADAITKALSAGVEPQAVAERPIFTRKMMPSTDANTGRPQWARDLVTIDQAVAQYQGAQCRTATSACLEVAQQSAWENMEETAGGRWNHGRPEINKALELAQTASRNFETDCEKPPEPIFLQEPSTDPIVKERFTISANALFGFDSYAVRPEGESEIRKLAAKLPSEAHITITGHTDRFGTASYNKKLSAQRAEAVKNIITKERHDLNIRAEGKGSDDPKVTCPGPKNPKTISCLQPNRRVNIDVLNQ